MRPRPCIQIDIDRILDQTDDGVQVKVTASGKAMWLPLDHIECVPGAVVVPEWLIKKIKTRNRERGARK